MRFPASAKSFDFGATQNPKIRRVSEEETPKPAKFPEKHSKIPGL